jgi:microcystin-dependent protein
MWSGALASIPDGWALCDGTNSTPDLTDRFIVATGTTYTAIGATGGQDSFTIAETNIPEHDHDFSAAPTLPDHVHGAGGYRVQDHYPSSVNLGTATTTVNAGTMTYANRSVTGNSGNPTTSPAINVSGTTTTYGSATPTAIDNRPAYYALAFIMKL